MALMLLDEFLHLAVSTISIICLSMMRYGKHWKGVRECVEFQGAET